MNNGSAVKAVVVIVNDVDGDVVGDMPYAWSEMLACMLGIYGCIKEDGNAELRGEEQAELERGHELVNYVLEGVEVGEVAAEEEEEEKEEKKGSDERNSRQWWSFESVEVKVKLEVE